MEIRYDWKTKLFSKKFEIYQNEQLKGELFKEGLSRKVTGELNTKRFQFETKGFFRTETTVTDLQRHVEVGKINYFINPEYECNEYRIITTTFIIP